jgi:hypothetical protein
VGKQALGLAMLLYHIFLSCFCAKVYPKATVRSVFTNPARNSSSTIDHCLCSRLIAIIQSVGAVVHVPLAVAFAWWLKSTGFF